MHLPTVIEECIKIPIEDQVGPALGPVRIGHIDIEFELISKYLWTTFEMPSTSNRVGGQNPTDFDQLHGASISSDQENQ